MKLHVIPAVAITVTLLSTYCMAADFTDQAVIVSTAPNMVPSPPTCTMETVPAPAQKAPERSVLGMVAGAAVGGLLGHQAGKGRGQTVTTIGGAVAGAVVGDKIANSGTETQSPATQQQRCTQNPPQQQGWLTTYTYGGRTFTEVTPWSGRPGQTFGVAVHLNASGSSQGSGANGGAR